VSQWVPPPQPDQPWPPAPSESYEARGGKLFRLDAVRYRGLQRSFEDGEIDLFVNEHWGLAYVRPPAAGKWRITKVTRSDVQAFARLLVTGEALVPTELFPRMPLDSATASVNRMRRAVDWGTRRHYEIIETIGRAPRGREPRYAYRVRPDFVVVVVVMSVPSGLPLRDEAHADAETVRRNRPPTPEGEGQEKPYLALGRPVFDDRLAERPVLRLRVMLVNPTVVPIVVTRVHLITRVGEHRGFTLPVRLERGWLPKRPFSVPALGTREGDIYFVADHHELVVPVRVEVVLGSGMSLQASMATATPSG
jgi:hypothetical protein